MFKQNNFLLVEDILIAALKIQKYTEGFSFEQFSSDDKTFDAVIRNFEIIGEAAARLDDEFKQNNGEIAWQILKGYRNRLIHEYFGVDQQIVWDILKDDLPQLILNVKEIIKKS